MISIRILRTGQVVAAEPIYIEDMGTGMEKAAWKTTDGLVVSGDAAEYANPSEDPENWTLEQLTAHLEVE